MSTLISLAGIAASLVAAFELGIPAYILCAAGFVLGVIGGFLGGRVSLAVAAMVLAAFVFAVSATGMTAILTSMDVNPLGFFRKYDGRSGLIGSLAILTITLLIFRTRAPRAYESMLDTSDDFDRVVVGMGKLASWLFVPLMLIIFYDVSQRKWLDFDTSIMDTPFYVDSTKLQEMEWHLHAVLFLLCLGFAYRADGHVRIELIRDRLSQRARVWMELAGIFLFLLTYCYLIVQFGWAYAGKSYQIGEVSAAQTGLSHRWIIKGMLPVGFALLFAAGVSAALRCVVYLFGPTYLNERSGDYAGTHHADLPKDVATNGPITD